MSVDAVASEKLASGFGYTVCIAGKQRCKWGWEYA
jgi:hypothetical protein